MKRNGKHMLLCMALVFVYMANMCAFAETGESGQYEIKIEGENFAGANCNAKKTPGEEFSGGALETMYTAYERGKVYKISYKVNAEKAGGYNLKILSTYLNISWTSNYDVVINNETRIAASEVFSKIKNINSAKHNNLLAYYDLGKVNLKKGENTVDIEIDERYLTSAGMITFYCDYMLFSKLEDGIYQAELSEKLGIFERKENVRFKLLFSDEIKENRKISYVIKDFWARTVMKGSFKAEKNSDFAELDIGKLGIGWYEAEFKDINGVKKRTFAVTPNQSERLPKETDTPFAVCFASQILKNGVKDIPEYSRAAKLLGTYWVREIFSYGGYNTGKGKYAGYTNKAIKIFDENDLDVAVMFEESPKWAVERGYFPADLRDVYNAFYNMAKDYGSSVDMWECWNEQDSAYSSEPADEYAAFMKAFAVAIADSGAKTHKSVGGFAVNPLETDYNDLCMQNGIMEYSDIYNFHCYASRDKQDVLADTKPARSNAHHNIPGAYDGTQSIPVWVTEGGLKRPVDENNLVSWENQKDVAKAVVMKMLRYISQGTTKYFWFILGSYLESGNFGMFGEDKNVSPVYAAYSNMTYQLGEGKYKGTLSALPEGGEGYMFESFGKNIAVVWSDNAAIYKPKGKISYICDVMGNKVNLSKNGEINISEYPLYVHYENKAPEEDYFKQEYERTAVINKTFAPEKKVIMCQRVYGAGYNGARNDGYTIFKGQDNKINLEVYNFNDFEITAEITCTPESGGFKAEEKTKTVTVKPKDREVLEFNIIATDEAVPEKIEFMRFDGMADGKKMSPSVSKIAMRSPERVEPLFEVEGWQDAKNWDLKNLAADSKASVEPTVDGGMKFRLEFLGGLWIYPRIDVKDRAKLEKTDGICFDLYSDSDIKNFGLNCFLDYVDGRRYYLSNEAFIEVKKGWNQVKLPWGKFVIFSSPVGAKFDTRVFDRTLIGQIEIGGNKRGDCLPVYTVKNLGYYVNEYSKGEEKEKKIIIELSDKTLKKGDVITAYIPEEFSGQKKGVVLNYKNYESFEVSGNKMTINTSALERGHYRMLVYSESEMGYKNKTLAEFNIE